MEMNNDKCQLLISGNKHEHMLVKISNDRICDSNDVRVMGITIDSDLNFKRY